MAQVSGTQTNPTTTPTSPITDKTGGGSGNQELAASFDYAIKQASITLSITTEKGADLNALKQGPR